MAAVSARLGSTVLTAQHEQQAGGRERHHDGGETGGQAGGCNGERGWKPQRARRVSNARARNRMASGSNTRPARCGVSSQAVCRKKRRERLIRPTECTVRREAGWGEQRVKQRREKRISRRPREPPRHSEQGHREQDENQCRNGLKPELVGHAPDACRQRRQHGDQRLVSEKAERHPAIPVRPPGGTQPARVSQPGQRHPEAVHGVHVGIGDGEQLAANVGVDPHQDRGIQAGEEQLAAVEAEALLLSNISVPAFRLPSVVPIAAFWG